MNKHKVLVTDNGFMLDEIVNGEHLTRLKSMADVVRKVPASDAEMAEDMANADAIILGDSSLTGQMIEKTSRLKVIARVGIGYDNIDLDVATRKHIIVTNVPGALSESVAEQAILLMLAVARRLTMADRNVREGRWLAFFQHRPDFELSGKTLGLVGFGAIGSAVSQRAKAFNMKILVYDPYINDSKAATYGCRRVEFATLLKESDVVSVHTPLTTETRALIGEHQLNMMKKTAILINTARGAVVDENSLVRALKEGKIAGAGTDVLTTEPPNPGNALLQLENVTLTPHCAAFTTDALKRLWIACADTVIRVLSGELPQPPANIVNRDVLPLLK